MRSFFPEDAAGPGARFLLALGSLTRFPVGAGPVRADLAEPGALAAGWAFPLVGALVGILCAIAYWIAMMLALPPLVAALVAVGAGVLITGALHEDGLAHMVDGLGGTADAPARLAPLGDARHGSYGILALIFSVGLRAAAIAFISRGGEVLAALVAAHAVGRGALPVVLAYLAPAGGDGLDPAAGQATPLAAVWSAGIAAVLALVCLGLGTGIEALISAAVLIALVAVAVRRQTGGQIADVLGAIEQTGETVVLLAAAAWLA